MQSNAENIIDLGDVGFPPTKSSESSHRRAQLESYLYTVYQNADYPTEIKPVRKPDIPKAVSPLLLVGITLFLVIDALLSISLLKMGSIEGASLLQLLGNMEFGLFFLLKSVVTSTFLITVAIHRHYRTLSPISGKRLLTLAFGAYTLLLIYQLRLAW